MSDIQESSKNNSDSESKNDFEVIELSDSSDSNSSNYSFEFTDENCDKRINEFVDITNTNSALAFFFLQDRKWNVQRSLDAYYSEMKKKEKKGRKRIVLCRPDSSASEADDEDDEMPRKNLDRVKIQKSRPSCSRSQAQASTSSSDNTEEAIHVEQEELKGKMFRHVTWNIDGMQPKNLPLRMKAICDILVKEKVSIVFFQEVTFECEEILERELSKKFHFFSGFNSTTEYFTLTLVSKGSFFKVSDSDVLNYENTFMGRNLLIVNVTDGKRKYCLLNSHLESTKEGSDFRREQLKFMLNYFKTLTRDITIIAGGDFNVRDTEIAAIGGLPKDVIDTWIASGSRKECEFTWDTLRNDTLSISGKWKPRCRFDRVYVRKAFPTAIQLVHFGLLGIERLKPNVCFPSDHWGVITSYRFE